MTGRTTEQVAAAIRRSPGYTRTLLRDCERRGLVVEVGPDLWRLSRGTAASLADAFGPVVEADA